MKPFTYSVPIVLFAIFSIASGHLGAGSGWNRFRNKQTSEPTTSTSTPTTSAPSPHPTQSPSISSCEFTRCAEIALIVDNTGGLSNGICKTQLDNIGELLMSFKGNDNPKVAYVEVNAQNADIVVSLADTLNGDIGEYVSFIESRECGECGEYHGQTNLDAGMLAAFGELIMNGNEECIQKIVIVMNCDTNDRDVICQNAPDVLQNNSIEVIEINALGAKCDISESNNYLNCITNNSCVVNDLRDDSAWRRCIDEQQNVICSTPTNSPTANPVTIAIPATPLPTPWPTPLPTPFPTPLPTRSPTPMPTYDPTEAVWQTKRLIKRHRSANPEKEIVDDSPSNWRSSERYNRRNDGYNGGGGDNVEINTNKEIYINIYGRDNDYSNFDRSSINSDGDGSNNNLNWNR